MAEQKLQGIGPSGIDLVFERSGNEANPPVILIMGVGGQLTSWPDGFIETLTDCELQVIRFDNRDVGLSSHLYESPVPDITSVLAGDLSSVPYTLSDMAADTAGLMKALGLTSAHIVGFSMGGAIAQTLAMEHPRLVRSLTSVMSTTGSRNVGHTSAQVLAAMTGSAPATEDEMAERTLSVFRLIASPAFPTDEEEVEKRARRAYRRAYDVAGITRQAAASLASGDRTHRLERITTPTLVIHGGADSMCDVSGGRATAENIPGARLEIIEGMGHDIPPGLWPTLCRLISNHIRNAESGSSLQS